LSGTKDLKMPADVEIINNSELEEAPEGSADTHANGIGGFFESGNHWIRRINGK
jgi:hypothetical protein